MSTVAFRKVAELSNKENVELKKVELSAEKVELKMDFSQIKKRVDSRLKELNKIHNVFIKLLPKIQEVKKGYESLKSTPKFEEKEVEKYFKDFDKKASDLGIDTKTTQFYKEYLDTIDKVGQMDDIVQDLKARL